MITIVSYQDRWPSDFARLATTLRAALGERAHSIHHIGSTSVPDLAAKDILDVQVTVRELEPSLASALEPLGFERTAHTTDHAPFALARESYAEIKRQLARYFPENTEAYYDVKDPVCDALMAGALEGKRATRWEPPESAL